MEAITSSLAFRPPVSGHLTRPGTGRPCLQVLAASRSDSDNRKSGSKIVNENMIVLRMRIREMRMLETKYEAPAEWMKWEKKYYTSYDSDICEAVGLLQRFLMSTRPSVALGMLVLVGLSVPSTVLLVFINLIEVGKGIVDVALHH